MSDLKVDLLLSCGHVAVVAIEAVIFAPRTGDEFACPQCGSGVEIKDVGVPWHDTDIHEPAKPTEGQLPLFPIGGEK
jgi:hypothetical protein